MQLNEIERQVLACLARRWNDGETSYYFRSIAKETGLGVEWVRVACRSLTDKGLAQYRNGLFCDDGSAAGSGYHATECGVKTAELTPAQGAV